MKKEIHPSSYRTVVFEDVNNGKQILTRSTVQQGNKPETVAWKDGQTYPLIKVSISAFSHPVYTGEKMSLNKLTNIAKFNLKYKRKKPS